MKSNKFPSGQPTEACNANKLHQNCVTKLVEWPISAFVVHRYCVCVYVVVLVVVVLVGRVSLAF